MLPWIHHNIWWIFSSQLFYLVPKGSKKQCCTQCCKFPLPSHPRLPVLGQGYLLPEPGSLATGKDHISASRRPTELHNHSLCSGNGRLSPLKASVFKFFCPLLLTMAVRATNIWSGLPDFQGRSPAGLPADFKGFQRYCTNQSLSDFWATNDIPLYFGQNLNLSILAWNNMGSQW